MKKLYNIPLQIVTYLTALMLLMLPSVSATAFNTIELEVNQSYFYSNADTSDIMRVSVVNPKIADVNIIDHQSINILGISPGSTSLTIWFNDGTIQQLTVYVASTDRNSANAIEKAINLPGVSVKKVDGKILLQGTVENQYEKEQAQNIASLLLKTRTAL